MGKRPEQDKKSRCSLNVVDKPGDNSIAFNLMLGFDVEMVDGNMNVFVNDLVFTSDGPKSLSFISTVEDETVKTTISVLCIAASKHILMDRPNIKFARATIPDPRQLNRSDVN